MAVEVSVVRGDVTAVAADVLLLKHAQGRYGADEVVAALLTRHGRRSDDELSPADGGHVLVPSDGEIAAANVLFVGVPRLYQFRYRDMRVFARRAIQALAESRTPVRTLATTVHGPGYGLDIEEGFRWLVAGFQQGLTTHPLTGLRHLLFVERNAWRFDTLQSLVADVELVMPSVPPTSPTAASVPMPEPTRKKSVFVAMPFTDEFEDVYQFSIYAAVRRCGYICEKVDESVFTDPIVERITEGIRNSTFVIADLSLERPNVYLEVGYAWALRKPVVLVAREGQRLHFDLSHHKCLFYRNITRLSAALEKTILDMFGPGGKRDMADIPQAVAALLAAQRNSLNERFATRLRGGARIDPLAFLAHLRDTVSPLLAEVHARYPERAPAVLTALYDASLDLFAASLLGPEAKLPAMQHVWTELLPNAVALLAREPMSLVGCLCNATFRVAQQGGTRPGLWLGRMRSALPNCQSVADAVDAGVVAAWQAGMPQFRGSALAAAERMKPKPAAASLGLPADTSAEVLHDTLASLKRDRWFRTGAAAAPSPALLPVGHAGAFTGFGGPFPHPPTVRSVGGRLVVSVGDTAHWQLVADAYGMWFRRVEGLKIKPVPLPAEIAVDAQGTVRWGRSACKAPHLTGHTGVACDGETLAITIPTSHHVFLFARTGGAA